MTLQLLRGDPAVESPRFGEPLGERRPDGPETADPREAAPSGVGGWLLVLCVLLVVWQPMSVGLTGASALASLAWRGWPLAAALFLRIVVTALGVGAGLALLNRRPGAVGLAKLSLVASAATDVFLYSTSFVPNNRPPGATPVVVIATLLYHVVWLTYLVRSRRVRLTY